METLAIKPTDPPDEIAAKSILKRFRQRVSICGEYVARHTKEPLVLKAQSFTLETTWDEFKPSEIQKRNGALPTVTLESEVTFKTVRLFGPASNGWGDWVESRKGGTIKVVLKTMHDELSEIAPVGAYVIEVTDTLFLEPIDCDKLPPEPSHDIPLAQRISHLDPEDQVKALSELAQRNDPEAIRLLADHYQRGDGVPANEAKARQLRARIAHVFDLPLNRQQRKAGEEQAWIEAFARFGAVNSGDSQIQAEQDLMFQELLEIMPPGKLSTTNLNKLTPRIEAMADDGHVKAAEFLAVKNLQYGKRSLTDLFPPLSNLVDLAPTVQRLRRAQDQGSQEAAFHLGRLAMEGQLSPQQGTRDVTLARDLLHTAYDRGSALAPVVLSVLDYAESQAKGVTGPRQADLAYSARTWARLAADRRDIFGQYLYGRMLSEAVGGSADPELARVHLRAAEGVGLKLPQVPPKPEPQINATATASVGSGGVSGAGTSWELTVQFRNSGTLNHFILIDGKTGRQKASLPSGRAFRAGDHINSDVSKLFGMNAQAGDRIDITGNGYNVLFSVTIPAPRPQPAPAKKTTGILPELQHYIDAYFPSSAATTAPATSLQTKSAPPADTGVTRKQQRAVQQPPESDPDADLKNFGRRTRRSFP